jgi:hypothetical protein
MKKKLFALTLAGSLSLCSLVGCEMLDNLLDSPGVVDEIGNENKHEIKEPPIFSDTDSDSINSLDEMNYYSAVCVISKTPMPLGLAAGNYRTDLLHTNGDEPDGGYSDSSDKQEENNGVGSEENNAGEFDEGVYYYYLSRDDVFSFDKVSMFKIELTDENGFLASIFGLGVVDVVISENCIWGDSLITFKRGDKFFSCLSNGYTLDNGNGARIEFSTHKFVEGFAIVKNLEQENYSFTVAISPEGQVSGFECGLSEQGGERPDQNVEVASSTLISSSGGRFTLAELEAYFKQDSSDENDASANQNEV